MKKGSTMRMQKRKFRIGQLANKLNVERFVIRFWEKEFNLKSARSDGGQRFYDEDDLATFTQIKSLLYEKGFTIAGAKKQLIDKIPELSERILASLKTTINTDFIEHSEQIEQQISQKASLLKRQLMKMRELL